MAGSSTDTGTLLDVQSAQLTSSIALMEESARAVIDVLNTTHDELAALGRQMQALLKEAQSTVSQGQHSTHEADQAYRHIQQRILHRRQALLEDRDAASQAAQHVTTIRGSAEALSVASRKIRVLAINAKLEASRAGGAAFGVVAAEMRSFADESDRSARSIADEVERLESVVRDGLLARLEESARQEDEERQATDAVVKSVGEGLMRTARQMEKNQCAVIASAEATTRKVGDLLLQALGRMQFQDVLRQRLEHVIECLEAARNAVNGCECHAELPMEALSRRYVSDAQREQHHRVVSDAPPAAALPGIELF